MSDENFFTPNFSQTTVINLYNTCRLRCHLLFLYRWIKGTKCAVIRGVSLLTCYCYSSLGNCILECVNNNEDTSYLINFTLKHVACPYGMSFVTKTHWLFWLQTISNPKYLITLFRLQINLIWTPNGIPYALYVGNLSLVDTTSSHLLAYRIFSLVQNFAKHWFLP